MDLLQMFKKEPMWTNRPLKSRYDVVIVGAGVHGLATAYYLTKQGVTGFQEYYNLKVDGDIGSETRGKMKTIYGS